LEKIANLLGHANLNTTQIYLVPDARDLEQAVGKLENY
jgi:site-specific recombinase XerD